jgi:rubredoxin-NAD+ reductase
MNCGWIYKQAEGDPDSGVAPGTDWNDIPADWTCPICRAAKSDFDMVEI